MLKVLVTLYILLSFTGICSSQERYLTNTFDDIAIETFTYATKEGQNLDMDVYLPQADAEEKRAMLIFVHGGGFASGRRNQENIVDFCTQMSTYGYVVASISYRLTRKGKPGGFGCNCPANDKLNTFYAAVEDIQDATFFLIENRHQFAIDPQKIILAGSSAGAEAVLNTAYQPPYCYGLDSGPVSFAGVISLSGAIPDTTVLYKESVVPSLFFHGTNDRLVPYATAPHHYCDKADKGYLILHGPLTIAEKLDKLQTPYWLHTSCGAGHEIHSSPLVDYFDVLIDFCYSYVINKGGKQKHSVIKSTTETNTTNPYNFCTK